MINDERKTIEAAIDLCIELRNMLRIVGSSQTRLLIDMLLLDLGKMLALLSDPPSNGADPAP